MSSELSESQEKAIAYCIVTLSVIGIVLYSRRLEAVLWHKGYRSPFISASVFLGLFFAFFVGAAIGFVRADQCSLCVVFQLENGERAPQWLRVASVLLESAGGVAVIVALGTVFVHRLTQRVHKHGWRRSRVPWSLLSYLSIIPLAIVIASALWAGFDTSHVRRLTGVFPIWLSIFTVCREMTKRNTVRSLQQVVAEDPRPRVLYLRAFQSEGAAFATVSVKERWDLGHSLIDWLANKQGLTFELYMSNAVSSALGPFVALGDPYDYLPPEGAARDYVANNDWWAHFVQHCEQCSHILVVPGVSGNLGWELDWIRKRGMWHKLFIVTHHRSLATIGAQYWDAFARISRAQGIEIGSYPGAGAVVGFHSDGAARLIGGDARTPQAYVNLIAGRASPTATA